MMLDFALRLRLEGDVGAVEWLRATGRKGHPLACMRLAFQSSYDSYVSFSISFGGTWRSSTCWVNWVWR